jgi:integrase
MHYSSVSPDAVASVFRNWITEKRFEIAKSTLDFYEQTATSFLGYLGDRAALPIHSLERKEILSYRHTLLDRLSPKTVNHRIKTLRMIFEAAVRDRVITENPARYIKAARASTQPVRRAFELAEIRLVLAHADPEWQSIILFGLYTGQRLGDIARLEWRQIDSQKRLLSFVSAKTGRRLVIPIAAPLSDHLQKFASFGNGPIHPRAYSSVVREGGRVSSLSNQFASLLAAAGLRTKISHLETGRGHSRRRIANELSFHSLRHTTVSLLKEASVPQAVVMELIGHRSPEISWAYTHVGVDALRQATSSIPSL